MGLFRDMLNEARNTSVPTEYRIALGQLKRMYNTGEVPGEKELQKDAEMIAKKNHLEEDKFFEFVKSQFKINESEKIVSARVQEMNEAKSDNEKLIFQIENQSLLYDDYRYAKNENDFKARILKHKEYLSGKWVKKGDEVNLDNINWKLVYNNIEMNETKKEFDKDATSEDKANAIMKRCKAFRADSTIGYLLDDADIIQGITDATKWSFKDSEKYFKDNYKSIKMNEAKSKEDLIKYYEKNLKNVEKEYSTDSRKQEYIDYAKGQLAAVKKDGTNGLIKFLKDWNLNESKITKSDSGKYTMIDGVIQITKKELAKIHKDYKSDNTILTMIGGVTTAVPFTINESAVGTPGRTTVKDAEAHINDELIAEFKKIIKKLGGKTVAKVLLDKLGQKLEIKDEIEHIEDIINNSNY